MTPATNILNISLLQALASEYHDHSFVLSFGGELFKPEEVISWRGDYYQPSLTYTKDSEVVLGCALWKILEDGVCNTHEGYKGGEYVYSEEDSLWVDNYGEYSRRGIVGYVLVEGAVQLLVEEVE